MLKIINFFSRNSTGDSKLQKGIFNWHFIFLPFCLFIYLFVPETEIEKLKVLKVECVNKYLF